jgi:hypothetical protein
MGDGLVLTIDQASQLARASTFAPRQRRDWVLRVLDSIDEPDEA